MLASKTFNKIPVSKSLFDLVISVQHSIGVQKKSLMTGWEVFLLFAKYYHKWIHQTLIILISLYKCLVSIKLFIEVKLVHNLPILTCFRKYRLLFLCIFNDFNTPFCKKLSNYLQIRVFRNEHKVDNIVNIDIKDFFQQQNKLPPLWLDLRITGSRV